MKKILERTEFYIFLVVVVLGIIIQAKSGQFFTGNNFNDICRAMIVPGMFAIGTFLIIVSGGIDVSFPAMASLIGYAVVQICLAANYNGPIIVELIIAGLMGIALGAINGLLIGKMRLPALIVTLGTSSVFRGVLQGALAAEMVNTLPEGMNDFGKAALYTTFDEGTGMTSVMPLAILFYVVVVFIVFLILRFTMLGRGIYAVGGNEESALRAGFRVVRIRMFIYCFAGMLAGITGVIRFSLMAMAHPTNLIGMEMTVIAAIVLGGASITGGVGTLTGTVLGIALLTIVENSLILIGVPAYWQQLFTGVLIIVGTAISSVQFMRKRRPKKVAAGAGQNS